MLIILKNAFHGMCGGLASGLPNLCRKQGTRRPV
jgi:hypothetical protein